METFNNTMMKKEKDRTKLREAQTKAAIERCREYGNDLVEVSRHNTTCEVCNKFEGKIFSISGQHPNFPPLKETPPFHDKCRHSILPTSDSEIEIREREKNGN